MIILWVYGMISTLIFCIIINDTLPDSKYSVSEISVFWPIIFIKWFMMTLVSVIFTRW